MTDLLFQPCRLHLAVCVDIDVMRYGRTCIGELMWNAGWNNHDLACRGLNRLITHNKRETTLLDDEDLCIGMRVQRWATPWWCGGHKERYVDISIVIAFKLSRSFTRQAGCAQNVRHTILRTQSSA